MDAKASVEAAFNQIKLELDSFQSVKEVRNEVIYTINCMQHVMIWPEQASRRVCTNMRAKCLAQIRFQTACAFEE